MRRRFFFTTLAALLVTVGTVATVQSKFFRDEQSRLVDRRIEEMASALYSSDLSVSEIEDVEEANDIIADALGQERVDLVIVLYDKAGKPVYTNRNAALLGAAFHLGERWQTVERGHHLIRLLSLRLPNTDRTLQVGILMDRDLIRWRQINTRLVLYIVLVIGLVVAVSYFLSVVLLHPLRVLARYLRHLATSLDTYISGQEAPSIVRLRRMAAESKDEVRELAVGIDRLVDRIRETAKSQRARTAQLAHELKTPLTIARNAIEGVKKGGSPEAAVVEIDRLTNIINGFLEWSALENAAGGVSHLHALKVAGCLRETVERLGSLYPGRLKLSVGEDVTVFAQPAHLEQVLSNLCSNALKYSPGMVEVSLAGSVLKIRDEGPGIPDAVLAGLGSPFNRGEPGGPGTGLGLAWVSAICQRYDWKIEFKSPGQGTLITVIFPKG